MLGYQLDDEPNLYIGKEMVGNHQTSIKECKHPLKNGYLQKVVVSSKIFFIFTPTVVEDSHFGRLHIFQLG